MNQAFYRKWRPHVWEEVVGQEHIIHTLRNAVRANRVGHAYLFAGPRGTGKTTTARLLAKAVNCLSDDPASRPCDQCAHCQAVNEGRFLDLIEIDAASNTSVEDVRDLRDKINFSPSQGKFKVYIIDEVHMLSTAAFNALLKTLEEPPPHAIFILATTEIHKIPATVLSRCQRYEFRRIPVNDIVAYLQKMAAAEGIDVETEALILIARQSTGALRDAISLLDQLASTGERITLAMAQTVLGTATNQAVIELVDAILKQQAAEGLTCVHRSLDAGADPRQFARQMVEHLRNLLLIRLGNTDQVEATTEMRTQMAKQAQAFTMPQLLELVRLFNTAATETRGGWQPALLLELAVAQSIEGNEPGQMSAPVATSPSRPVSKAPSPASPSEQPVEAKASAPQKEPTPQIKSVPELISTPPPSEGEITLAAVKENWRRIRAAVKEKNMMAEALLNSSRPLTIKDGILVLGFATEVLKSKMESRENIELVHKVLTQVLGHPLSIQCVVHNARGSKSDDDVSEDGLVNTALNLGGQIVKKE